MDKVKRVVLNVRRIMSQLNPGVQMLYTGHSIRNAERTSDEHAGVGESWKKYWQIFTLQDFPDICPLCGEPLNEDDVDGCHIEISGLMQGNWLTKKYIIPGHHRCNMQLGQEWNTKIAINAVEAIER